MPVLKQNNDFYKSYENVFSRQQISQQGEMILSKSCLELSNMLENMMIMHMKISDSLEGSK